MGSRVVIFGRLPPNKHKQNHSRNNKSWSTYNHYVTMSNHYVSHTFRLCGFMNVKTPMENTFGADVNKGSPIIDTYKATIVTTNP